MTCTVYTTVRRVGLSNAAIQTIVRRVGNTVGQRDAHVSVHFIGDRRMRRLNREFRGKDKTTDVLSFAVKEGMEMPVQEEQDWGDIFVSVPQIHRQAAQHAVSYREELIRMLVHGTLHIFGYDHETEKDAAIMFPLQERLVKKSL